MNIAATVVSGVIFAAALFGQSAVIRSVGQYEPSGTVLYSVYVASKTEALAEVTISSAIPAGTRFLENVDLPRGARYDGVADNVVFWTIPAVAADTLVGPFTYRLKLDGSVSDVPATAASAVSVQRPRPELIEVAASGDKMPVLADEGSVTFDQRGTLTASGENGPVAVGNTGVLFFVPDGAVTGRTTVTFRRLSVENNTLPASAADTWWCGLYQTTVEPAGTAFTKAVSFVLSTRRPITPGLKVTGVTTADLKEWQASGTERGIGFGFGGFGGGFGGNCFSGFGQFGCGFGGGFGGGFGFGGFGGFGISNTDKTAAAINSTSLT
ncbi:MAG: hypothetical protein JNL62_25830, partial [Bryobacterales bacterium]|nr:hypothetical protein [Bryobacterales bacterium]